MTPPQLAGLGLLGMLILAVLWLSVQISQLRTQLLPLTSSGLARALAAT